ncbi:cytochrome c3 family protein [Trichloromonas sp.]|uniref:cytochrome c3 family protein n=1 Tax=Trichloromonas sp. TaxID=3069249 RepID=UPI003D8142D5
MKTYGKEIMLVMLLVFVAGTSWAGQTLTKYGDFEGRTYHADLYKGEKCVACHGSQEPSGLPTDDVCLKCHDLEKLVTSTARPENEKWQNPHNNMHWGKDVPCMECHGEHQEIKPLCQGCHTFKYPKFKN